MTHIQYRKDIDGLRAIAIILVLIFHAFPRAVTGGFIGVDVFFVISGFLISKIILQELNLGTFSILDFYSRRIKRIFPALSLALLLTLILGWICLFSDEFKTLAKHVLAAATFTSNLVLWQESGYFDVSSELKPLLHLWSLGIEEQFYLIWPLLLGFCAHRKKVLFYVILVTIFLSFLLNVVAIQILPSFVFFNPLTRFWEMACGAFLAFAEVYKFNFLEHFRKTARTSNLLSGAGMVLILLSAGVLNEKISFPGFAALGPVLGCCFIIAAGPDASCNRFLSQKFFVFVGLISYPLYLFHWPLISFSHILYQRHPPAHVIWLMLATSFGLAWATYTFVEKPVKTTLKHYFSSKQMNLSLVSALAVVTLFGLVTFNYDGFAYRFEKVEATVKSKKDFRESNEGPLKANCIQKFFKIEMCAIHDISIEPTVALIGDSHAKQFYPALSKYFHEKNENLILLGKSGVPPMINIKIKRTGENSFENVIKWVIENPKIHTVILGAFWSNYFNEDGTTTGKEKYKGILQNTQDKKQARQQEIFVANFSETLKLLLSQNKKVIFFYDIMAAPFYVESCIDRRSHIFSSQPQIKSCSFQQDEPMAEQIGYRNAVEQILKTHPQIKTFDPIFFNCENSTCYVVKDDRFIYSDEHHLSIHGAEILRPKFNF